jgi:ribonuclease BN (tRNA processing enzyme)
VLDLGPDTLLELRKHADFRTLDGIIISHLHIDHTLDLLALRYLLKYNPIQSRGRIPLWMPPGGRAMLDRIASALIHDEDEGHFFEATFAIADYDPNDCLKIRDFSISFKPTVHYIPCWASRVSTGDPGEDLVYTADTSPAANLASFAKGAAVLIAESTLPGDGKVPPEERGHQTAAEAAQLAADADVDVLVLTHMWEEYGFDAYLADAQIRFGGTVELAKPGLRVTWPLEA